MTNVQLQEYLNRIGINRKVEVNYDDLYLIQKQHLIHVPFENLSILHGETISLDLDDLYRKIVVNKRGGFCYELNYLFYDLLKTIGFQVEMISASVYDRTKDEYGKEFDHLFLIVALKDKEYILDVGFGESSFIPLLFQQELIQDDGRNKYFIQRNDDFYTLNIIEESGKQRIKHQFQKVSREIKDFYGMCRYHQISDDSWFTYRRLCTVATLNGRITLSDDMLSVKVDKHQVREEKVDLNTISEVMDCFESLMKSK